MTRTTLLNDLKTLLKELAKKPTSRFSTICVNAKSYEILRKTSRLSSSHEKMLDMKNQKPLLKTAKTIQNLLALDSTDPALQDNTNIHVRVVDQKIALAITKGSPQKTQTVNFQTGQALLCALLSHEHNPKDPLWKLYDAENKIFTMHFPNARAAHLFQHVLKLENPEDRIVKTTHTPRELFSFAQDNNDHNTTDRECEDPITDHDSLFDIVRENARDLQSLIKSTQQDDWDLAFETKIGRKSHWKDVAPQKDNLCVQAQWVSRHETPSAQPLNEEDFLAFDMALRQWALKINTHPAFQRHIGFKITVFFLAEGWDVLWSLRDENSKTTLIDECDTHNFFKEVDTFFSRLNTIVPRDADPKTLKPFSQYDFGRQHLPVVFAKSPQDADKIFTMMNKHSKRNPSNLVRMERLVSVAEILTLDEQEVFKTHNKFERSFEPA